jgi:spermidine dehydrogenase
MSDRDLGLHRRITRRDFLNGIALGIGSAVVLPDWAAAWLAGDLPAADQMSGQANYPPARTGLRGSHIGSYEVFHALRDGTFWDRAGPIVPTGEMYDLAVIGGGISGLTAAYYYRKAMGVKARIIILDKYDDFGGHAKRNEFTVNGHTYLGYGGTQSIDSPAPYSHVAKSLIAELGIDVSRATQVLDDNLYGVLGLKRAFFFDRETFGVDRLVSGYSHQFPPEFLRRAPLSESVKRDLMRLLTEPWDPMREQSSTEKKARLARMSYAHFLTQMWQADADVLPLFQTRTHGLYGVGIDACLSKMHEDSASPGFRACILTLEPVPDRTMMRFAILRQRAISSIFPTGTPLRIHSGSRVANHPAFWPGNVLAV